MRNSLKFRTAMWASAGFLVAAGWGFYFASTSKADIADLRPAPIEPIVYTLARLTQPVAALTVSYFSFPLGLTGVALENAATYGLIGLIVETLWRHYHPLQNSN
jgi:hypothetical protein